MDFITILRASCSHRWTAVDNTDIINVLRFYHKTFSTKLIRQLAMICNTQTMDFTSVNCEIRNELPTLLKRVSKTQRVYSKST